MSGSPSQPGIEGIRKRAVANAISPSDRKLGKRSSARALRHERCAEHEQQVRHDATREGAADDLGQSFVNRDERDDELGGIPERGIEKPPIPGPVCSAACSVASPMSQASGIRASADRTNSVVSGRSAR